MFGHRFLIGLLWAYPVGGLAAYLVILFEEAPKMAYVIVSVLVLSGAWFWMRGPVKDDPILEQAREMARLRHQAASRADKRASSLS